LLFFTNRFCRFLVCLPVVHSQKQTSRADPWDPHKARRTVRVWFYPAALARGYDIDHIDRVWEILRAFASFGFCKAHAAAFALPTYQSAWLKTHHAAAFYCGLLTHDPGMYPKRLILDDARNFGVTILGLDVNSSNSMFHLEQLSDSTFGVRVSFTDLKEISEAEIERLVAGQPFSSLSDLWLRARPSRPVAENLVVAGAFDSLYGFTSRKARGEITRRDLLLQIADLDRNRGKKIKGTATTQLSFDVTESDSGVVASGLPEMTSGERVKSELEVLGLDVSGHVMDFYADVVHGLKIVKSRDLLRARSKEQFLLPESKLQPKCHRFAVVNGWCFSPWMIQQVRLTQLFSKTPRDPMPTIFSIHGFF